MGWRQFTLEMNPTMECPQECKCDVRTSKLCFVSNGGCDLRSSDSYIISERYYRWTLDKLINGGTVDYDVLPRAPGVLLTLPILSTQKRLDINIEHQAAVSDLFMERCLTGEVPEEVLGDVKFAEEELFEVDKLDTELQGAHRRVAAKQAHAEKAAAVAAENPDSAVAQRNAERAARIAAKAIDYKPNDTSEDEEVIAVVEGLMSASDDGSEETESTDAAESSDAAFEIDAEDAVVVPDPAIESILEDDTAPETTVSEENAQGAEPVEDDAPDSETSEEAAPEADAESNSDSGLDSDLVSDVGASDSGIQTSGAFIAQTQRR